MKFILMTVLALSSLTAFAQFKEGDVVQGKTSGHQTFLTSPALKWKKIEIDLEASIKSIDEVEGYVVLENIQLSDYGKGYKVQVTPRGKKFICEAFGLGKLKEFEGEVSKEYIKIRSLDSYVTREEDSLEMDGMIVFSNIQCEIN